MSRAARILCIEDDRDTGELICEVLEAEAFHVTLATNGIDGEMLLASRPDLVICDIDLPGISGLEVLRRLRSAAQGLNRIPFVVITALQQRGFQLEARRLGCDDYIPKPLDFELLIEIVRHRLLRSQELLGGQQPDFRLTEREAEVLTWVARGKSSGDIAAMLGIGERTVNFHVENVVRKVGVATRTQAAISCTRFGMITP